MATIKKYNGSTWENTIARKYETKSEIIVPPTTIYADGSNITAYTIKGNTVQSGTPTPSNPVPVVGVGELETTGEHTDEYKIPISSGGVTTNVYLSEVQSTRKIKKLVLDGTEEWDFWSGGTGVYYLANIQDYLKINGIICVCSHFPSNNNVEGADAAQYGVSFIFNNPAYRLYIVDTTISSVNDFKSWLTDQYAAGTPVTVWYVLATEETGIVNEPLMEIGTYADTLSNASHIPTTEGANSITVDTTVQPSEFTATWTGWHNASVKEWDGSDWNE